jgi:hypothetical protein
MRMIRTKEWSLIAIISAMLMGLPACSDDNEVSSKADLIGIWQEYYESYWEKENGEKINEYECTYDDDSFAWRFTFYEDGKYKNQEYSYGSWDDYWGKWTMESNTIYFDEGTEDEATVTIKTLNKNTLIIELYEKEVYSGTTYEWYSLQKYHRVTDEAQ